MKQYCDKIISLFGRSFLSLAVLLVVVIIVIYQLDSRGRTELIRQTERQNIDQQNVILGHEIVHAVNNLKVLAKNQFLSRYIEGHQESLVLAENAFLHFAQVNEQYEQIRFIDVNGMERLRIDRKDDDADIVPAEQLQSKADRYYFKSILSLDAGQIYFSRFDLNIENGVVEQPFRPMLRIATPVLNADGVNAGILIINYSGNHILDQLGCVMSDCQGTVLLLDQESYYLQGFNDADEWGFMFENKQALNFNNQFPEAWQKIEAADSGQFMTGQGLFTFKKFDSQTHLNHPQSELSNSTLAGLNWILVSFIAAPVFHPWILIFYISGTLLLLALLAIYSWSNAKANCQRMQAEQKLKDQATRDDLTGLANRHLFYERAAKVLSQSERMQHRFAVLFVDLDRFKQVNDELGHEAGDALLVEAAKRMQGIIRKPDTAARFGGDEFILLIPELKNTESVNAIAKKLIAALNEPFTLVKRGCTVEACIGASVGISIYPQDGAEIDILIRAADAAMYRAKNQGTGQYCQA